MLVAGQGLTAKAAAAPRVWYVSVGAESAHSAIEAMGFYPGVITIDAGDSVVWTLHSMEPHTVTFLGGVRLTPKLLSDFAPAGGGTYTGTGLHSSGMLAGPHRTYRLTFPKPGFYPYLCLMHGTAMSGLVIVNPAGTPYPMTQAQYHRLASQEEEAALAAGQAAASGAVLSTSPGPNGSTIYHVLAGIDSGPTVMTRLEPTQVGSTAGGQATLTQEGPGVIAVTVTVWGLKPGSVLSDGIGIGTCSEPGPGVDRLNPLKADARGLATATTLITGNPQLLAIPSAGWTVDVGPSGSAGNGTAAVACGAVSAPAATGMRFYPGTVTIHVGDQVQWLEASSMEIHTVTFLAKGQKAPQFGSPASVRPAGGPVYNGSGYFNSGVMTPGQTYTLTFTKPGVYAYHCLVHDDMGMIGRVIVLP